MKNVIKLPEIIRDILIITLLTAIGFSMAGCEDMIYNHNCETCHGSGKCQECSGEGKKTGYEFLTTPYFDSTIGQYVNTKEVMVKCDYCSGSGKCKICKGRGKVAAGGDGKFHF